MANTQLKGQVFNCRGVNYLVLDDNDWSASTLRVKTVDTHRTVSEMTLETVLECVFQGLKQPATT